MSMINRRTVLVAGLLIGSLATAIAQPPARSDWRGGPGMGPGSGMGPGMGSGMGMMGGGPGGFMNQGAYLDSLRNELRITKAQQSAWTAYADAVKGVAAQIQGVHQSMWQSMQTADWKERRDMMNNMFQARSQGFDIIHEAAEHLLPALSPEQAARARTSLPGLRSGGGWMHGGGGRGAMGPG